MASKPTLGFCVTGSFCTFEPVFQQMEALRDTYEILPISPSMPPHSIPDSGKRPII